ncbi:MAG: hypothetical protein F6J97_08910 [Leptolyngbya sp. SIO4C1]|nr:hypothetical protein [Leptolyngbya sp. SIO4C1]
MLSFTTDLAGVWQPQMGYWQVHTRSGQLAVQSLSTERLQAQLANLPLPVQQPSPRPVSIFG